MSKNTLSFHISGMHCASCAVNIQKKLQKEPGVEEALVNYANEQATVTFQENTLNENRLAKAVEEAGYKAHISTKNSLDVAEKERAKELSSLQKKLMVSIFLSAILMVGMIPNHPKIFHNPWLLWLLATPVQFWVGKRFYLGAWSSLKNFTATMDTLVVLGTSTAYFFSVFSVLFQSWMEQQGLTVHLYFETSAVIITFILLGKYLELRAKAKTTQSIKELLQLQAKTAWLKQKGEWVQVALETIRPQDILLVKPGEKVPVDGSVLKGSTTINESMITGESLPVAKKMGDTVIGSTLNQAGAIEIRAEKVGDETMLANIIRLVQQAQGSRPHIQAFVDTIAAFFVPVVIALAAVTFVGWYWLGPEPKFLFALVNMMNVLIIACPCALGLATPTSLMVGIGRGAKMGILIKDAQTLEIAHTLRAIVFDKTGTLTLGQPQVQAAAYAHQSEQKTLDAVVHAIESLSNHPLASALTTFTAPAKEPLSITDFSDHAGKGLSASLKKETVLIGSQTFLTSQGITLHPALLQKTQEWREQAYSVVHVARAGKHVASYALFDPIRETAEKTISTLKKEKITPIIVSGDNQQTVQAVAKKLGITEMHAEVLPGEKKDLIQNIRQQYKVVAMVGDGINDAPALASADVSIALGTGTDAAIETAGVTLLHPNLSRIPQALTLSRATMRNIRENLFWAFFYNVLLIPVAMGALYPFTGTILQPMMAGAAMAFSSLSVVGNALRLKTKNMTQT